MGGIDAVERIMATNPTMIPCSAFTLNAVRRPRSTLSSAVPSISFTSRRLRLAQHRPPTDEVVAKVDDFAEANVSSVALARATAAAH